MSLDNLGKKLAKEFKRSPAKSGLLVLMVPVAIYCIAPLIMKKGPQQLVPPTPNPAIAAASTVSSSLSPPTTPTAKPDAPTWEVLEKWRADDRLTMAATLTEEYRNPFEFIVTEKPLEVVEAPQSVAPVVEVKPVLDATRLPLELQGTIIGGRARRATINGHTFREGQRLRLDGAPMDAKEKAEPGTFLVLEEIQATSVTLTFGQQTIDLPIKSSNPLGAGQIVTRQSN